MPRPQLLATPCINEPLSDVVKAEAGPEEEFDIDNSEGEEDEDEEELEATLSFCQRQRRWALWEEACREAEGQARQPHEPASALQQHALQPQTSFLVLSAELLHILRSQSQGQSCDRIVDSVGDDVHTWSVELALSSFDPSSSLYQDMQEIQHRYKYSFIKLLIRFQRGLHPSYPPSVEVVRPRLKTASDPMLKLCSWVPWSPVEELIGQLKLFLQTSARVDLEHPMNDICCYPTSSYKPEELQLARLDLDVPRDLELPRQDEPELAVEDQDSSHLAEPGVHVQVSVVESRLKLPRLITRYDFFKFCAKEWKRRLCGGSDDDDVPIGPREWCDPRDTKWSRYWETGVLK